MTTRPSSLTVNIFNGDAKVLLAFNLEEQDIVNLAGFTIKCEPVGAPAYYIFNKLQFAEPGLHAQIATEPPNSSVNAPIQKFRWLHVPGIIHQQKEVIFGKYIYTVTPRYFKDEALLPIDKNLSVTAETNLNRFTKGDIELGFTRGFTQSQAFVNHFGLKASFKPKNGPLLFDTNAQAGVTNSGNEYSFKDEYVWSGFTAREKIFKLVTEVVENDSLFLDLFAYDLNEPDLMAAFLKLAEKGRIRIILDDAPLHHDDNDPKPEDKFQTEVEKINKNLIKRGHFGRFQHNKIMVVSEGETRTPVKVLTGSTNFSVTGMYVNSNHIIVIKDQDIVSLYQNLFNEAWKDKADDALFLNSDLSKNEFPFVSNGIKMFFTFAPHSKDDALKYLNKIAERVKAEKSSVLFAVMGTDPKTTGPIAKLLIKLHTRTDLFTAGITDSDNDLTFYKPNSTKGIRVTGKPGKTLLPPPFSKEVSVGIGHQVHHKFIITGFNTPDAVVWLGSSNLAQGGEMANADNLIEIHDQDIATAFALEALALVDHFHFRDKRAAPKKSDHETADVHTPEVIVFNVRTNDHWAKSYYTDGDLHALDRKLFSNK